MSPAEMLPVGHLLDGRYRIHKLLGQGGMGRVYLANDTRLANRPVACKEMIIGEGIDEQKAVTDFNREAKVLASLSHPAIPQIIDYFGENRRYYLVMEYVAGGDLQAQLDQRGPGGRFPEAHVLRWARQVLEVLAFLHGQQPPIIYRDLKPANIMIDVHGRAMLVDFGIARFLPPGGRGTQIGSVGYAPPEQYLGKLEPRSDLYSLAATMHHLLSGRDPQIEPPFSFPPLRELAPQVSMLTASIVMRALDKDPLKRPESARAMRDELPDPAGLAADGPANLAATGGSAAAVMPTIVLRQPVAAPSSPQGASAIPRAADLNPPIAAHNKPKPSKSARAKLAAETATQRSLILPPTPPKASISATAKTQDLGLKRAAVAAPATPRAGVSASAAPRPSAAVSPPPQLGPELASVAKNGTSAASGERSSSPADGALRAAPAATLNGRPSPAVALQTPVGGVTPAPAGGEKVGPRLVAAGHGLQFNLNGGRIVIGRAQDAADTIDIDLACLNRGVDRVSRRHAEIIQLGGDYFIRDLGSLNGTYVAGRGRLSRDQLFKLKDRDEVVLGGAKLEFRRD